MSHLHIVFAPKLGRTVCGRNSVSRLKLGKSSDGVWNIVNSWLIQRGRPIWGELQATIAFDHFLKVHLAQMANADEQQNMRKCNFNYGLNYRPILLYT